MPEKEKGVFGRWNPLQRSTRKRTKQVEDFVTDQISAARGVDLSYGKIPQDLVPERVLAGDMEKIRLTMDGLDKEAFAMAVETLLSARTVYILGIRSCAPLASFLSFYLHQILPDVRLLSTNSSNEIFEQLIRIGKEDVLIGISYPRYSMRVLKAMEFANDRQARTISVTDNQHSPINLYSSCQLLARSELVSIVDSLVAPMSVLNALVVALCIRRQKEVGKHLEEIDRFWESFQTYERDEIDPLTEEIALELREPEDAGS